MSYFCVNDSRAGFNSKAQSEKRNCSAFLSVASQSTLSAKDALSTPLKNYCIFLRIVLTILPGF